MHKGPSMKLEDIDIDWIYLIERAETLINLGEEFLNRRLADVELDPQAFNEYLAFIWTREGDGGYLREVAVPDTPVLGDLIGLDQIVATLRRNTMQFALGFPANNVLLWGAMGCGKSSAAKGLLGEFAPLGLRLIEVRKEDIGQLPFILKPLRALPYRFILFCDDLAFGEYDDGYRELKALLEGGIESRPENVLVYATSNRRHLLPEHPCDNTGDDEIHPEEKIAEKLSLAERFGLTLSFYPIDQETYLKIVMHQLRRRGLKIRQKTIEPEALQWAQWRGSHSGRIARQYADDLAGRIALAAHLRKTRGTVQK